MDHTERISHHRWSRSWRLVLHIMRSQAGVKAPEEVELSAAARLQSLRALDGAWRVACTRARTFTSARIASRSKHHRWSCSRLRQRERATYAWPSAKNSEFRSTCTSPSRVAPCTRCTVTANLPGAPGLMPNTQKPPVVRVVLQSAGGYFDNQGGGRALTQE